jgi:hypothetical protein
LLSGFPISYLGPIAAQGWAGSAVPSLNEGNLSAVPSLAMLFLALAALRLRMAWLLLDGDWSGVAEAARKIVAVTVATVILTGVAFASPGAAIVQAAALAVELAMVSTLARASEATW